MLGDETVHARTSAGIDTRGREVPAGPEWPIENCSVFPLGGTELFDATRDGATSAVRVLAPITGGLTGDHELKVRGSWYRIVGDAIAYVDAEDPELSGYDLTCTRGRG
ncbi:hypothetical protein [Gordonia sp. KTR9]|uniref:hypothetical protein n=1 Tax=Gordonia sp. KTR9 TaxID=337191 RepID=UPI0003166134|nr:hypothetical protein [Gordonia sp. KTR9]